LRRAFARGFATPDASFSAPEPAASASDEADEHVDEVDTDDAAVFGTTNWVLSARDAVALLIYGAFDPVEPVLSAVTLIDFGGRRSQTIVHARLAPFAQQFSVLATLAGSDAPDHRDRVNRALLRACMQNGDAAWPLVQRAPTFIAPTSGLPLESQRDAYRQLLSHTSDVGATAAALAQHPSDPWARATSRTHASAELERDAQVDEYLARAMARAHVAQELDALPNAWQSAIDYRSEVGPVEHAERALAWTDVAAYLGKLVPPL